MRKSKRHTPIKNFQQLKVCVGAGENSSLSAVSSLRNNVSDKTLLCTLRKASAKTGFPYKALLAAVKSGQIPSYQAGKSRQMVSVEEVLQATKTTNIKEE